MYQSDDVRMHRLLKVSTDLQDRMAEVHKLREVIRRAEAATRGEAPTDPGVVEDDELRA